MSPITTVGERIRKIRKEKKLTLEALAGEKITKGMLSLIENNKANPSMESLTYIAEQLGVAVAELLEEVSSQELQGLLEEAERLFNEDFEEYPNKYKDIVSIIRPISDKLVQGYESARLLDIYCRCIYQEEKTGWEEYAERAAQIYDEMNLTTRRGNLGRFRAIVKFMEHDYEKALQILIREREYVESHHAYIDPITRLDFDYHEAILHFAVGDTESAIRVMESAIDFSKKHRIFYLIDDLYRLAAGYAMLSNDKEKMIEYSNKLKLYGEFADDENSILFYHLIRTQILIVLEKRYLDAIQIIDEILQAHSSFIWPYFALQKGAALYLLGRYEETIQVLGKVEISSYVHHPFDLSMLYAKDAYIALSYWKLGEEEAALQHAKQAVDNISPLPHSVNTDFVLETYNEVKNKMTKNRS
ncbi:helix-turn-helix domain-containing protein [Caldibacillus lycopersici]|uniref:Helix-turn-helix domain-containing protein n=1 Tax=Perspicuibacillus lycopersici TaxID=1325689 RepID=A0AAE3LP22_9BACI|nr:helix-turn-helix transcriptional regulator [Perspicuibacillus lycopersici]MCU9615340.1 helix-turn-helix domain-containing protein [Perspicuibacillus lycopersici]